MLRDDFERARTEQTPADGVYSDEVLRLGGWAEPQDLYLASALALATAPAKALGISEQCRRRAYDWHAARLDEAHLAKLNRKVGALRPLLDMSERGPTRPEQVVSMLLSAAEDEATVVVDYEVGREMRCERVRSLRIGRVAIEGWWLVAESEATGELVRIPATDIRDVRVAPSSPSATGGLRSDQAHETLSLSRARPATDSPRRHASTET